MKVVSAKQLKKHVMITCNVMYVMYVMITTKVYKDSSH